MGAAMEACDASSGPVTGSEAVHKRTRHISDGAQTQGQPSGPGKALVDKDADSYAPGGEDIDEIIRTLPSWRSQLSLRGYLFGAPRSSERARRR